MDLNEFLKKNLLKDVEMYEDKGQNYDFLSDFDKVNIGDKIFYIKVKEDVINNIKNNYIIFIKNKDFDKSIIKYLKDLYSDSQVYLKDDFIIISFNDDNKDLDFSKELYDFLSTEFYISSKILYLNEIKDLNLTIKNLNKLKEYIFLSNKNFLDLGDLFKSEIFNFLDVNYFKDKINYFFDEDINNSLHEELIETGIKFIDNSLNISKTAKQMYIHRNTLNYRLDRIKEGINLDIKEFKDALIFYILVNIKN